MTHTKEMDMNNRDDNTPRPEVQDDIIDLGAASVETQGGFGNIETVGRDAIGISDA